MHVLTISTIADGSQKQSTTGRCLIRLTGVDSRLEQNHACDPNTTPKVQTAQESIETPTRDFQPTHCNHCGSETDHPFHMIFGLRPRHPCAVVIDDSADALVVTYNWQGS